MRGVDRRNHGAVISALQGRIALQSGGKEYDRKPIHHFPVFGVLPVSAKAFSLMRRHTARFRRHAIFIPAAAPQWNLGDGVIASPRARIGRAGGTIALLKQSYAAG